jgi:hypothetical protein
VIRLGTEGTIDENQLRDWLRGYLSDWFGRAADRAELFELRSGTVVADSTRKFLLREPTRTPRAFLLCSVPAAPDMVRRYMQRARVAKRLLGQDLGKRVLAPMLEGEVGGMSCAVLPYCNELSNFPPVWFFQRRNVVHTMLEWLGRVTRRTVRAVSTNDIEVRFFAPLQHIADMSSLDERIKNTARMAIKRLGTEWRPRYVLMHGDFWKGNLLVQAKADVDSRWADRLTVIDWPLSSEHGYGIYDLIRFARSLQVRRRTLQGEVYRHCETLECEPTDALCYLMAAVGHIGMHLEHFPIDRYVRMVTLCFLSLAGLVES